jgi:hypothetical protein
MVCARVSAFRLRARRKMRNLSDSQRRIKNPPADKTAPMPKRVAEEKRSNQPEIESENAITTDASTSAAAIPIAA